MSKEDEKETIEEIEEEKGEEKKVDDTIPFTYKKEDLQKILDDELNKRFPPKPPKTKAKKIPESEEEDETEIMNLPTCPHCHKVVKETADGWVCFNCSKYYTR